MCLPFIFVIIGLIITEFADFIIANTLSSSFNTTINITAIRSNITFDHFCADTLIDNDGFFDYISSSDPQSLLRRNMYSLSYGIAAIAVAYLLSISLSTIAWSLTATNQENKIKVKFIKAVLNQDISHYDLRPSTELSVHLIKLDYIPFVFYAHHNY